MSRAANAGKRASGVWLSIGELAEAVGQAKSTVSRRVAKLEGDGLIAVRVKAGRKTVERGAYDSACAATVDAVKSLNGSAGKAGRHSSRSAANLNLVEQQTRRAKAAADILEAKRDAMRGSLLHTVDVEAAMAKAAAEVARVLERLPTRAGELVAIVTRDGEHGLRGALKNLVRETRQSLADGLRALVASEGQSAEREDA